MLEKQFKDLITWAISLENTEKQNHQRGHLLASFLALFIVAISTLAILNIFLWLFRGPKNYPRLVFVDLITLAGLILIWLLNRKGRTNLAAHMILTFCVVSINFIFKPEDLVHGFALFTIPVLMSSFVLSARWAFFYTTLATIVYSLVYWITSPATDYEYLIVVSLYIFAGISYLIASRYKTAMQYVRASEESFRTLFDRVPVGLYRTTADGDFLDANPTFLKLFGCKDLETLKQLNAANLYAKPEAHDKWLDDFSQNAVDNQYSNEAQFQRLDGSLFWATDATRAVYGEKGISEYYEGSLTDITARKQAEQALQESEERFRHIFKNATVGIYRTTPGGEILMANSALIRMLGYDSLKELAARSLEDDGFEPEYPRNEFQERVEREGVISGLESAWKRKDGTTIYIRESAKCVRDENGRVLYYEGTVEDISERIQAEDKVRQKINQLTALRKIDTTIASSTDLQLCLNTILNETKRLLEVDATDILLFDPHMYRLEFAAGLGFYTRNVEKISMRLGESLAGKAALDQKRLEMHRINDKEKNRLSHLKGEKITCYHAVPLIVKGKIKGVLEVYLRKHAQHTAEWGDFLETLAGQAAIAIDNSQMFDGLQQSNFEMTMAYDQVIEGWAQALDLREKETGNHAKRVTEMTVKLASAMGFKDKDLLHIRYGALLHDIGKMGVPDHILLKPGKLTESEWAVVRQHPQYAYNLLNQIPYLQPSLDIPYAHHEKWDGSGYPLGLEGENIPFQARIFAVVDVYDALISDKPYRNKWPKQKALDYIEDQSGKHFDPDVVKVFLREFRSELLR